MKSSNNIITEGLFSNSPIEFGNKLGKLISKYLCSDDFINDFDGNIVSKQCFSFKSIFDEKIKPEISTDGKYGVTIQFVYIPELNNEEIEGLVFGKDEKNVGIIWNPVFTGELAKANFDKSMDNVHPANAHVFNTDSDGNNDEDDDDEELNESILPELKIVNIYKNILLEQDDISVTPHPDELNLKIIINFDQFKITSKVKKKNNPKNKYNSKYIIECSGSLYMSFDGSDNGVHVCDLSYYPKRMSNDDPGAKGFFDNLAENLKDAWDKTPSDHVATDNTAATAILKSSWINRKINGQDNKCIQEEDLQIQWQPECTLDNIKLDTQNITSLPIKETSNNKFESTKDTDNIENTINSKIDNTPYTIDFIYINDDKQYYKLIVKKGRKVMGSAIAIKE